MNGSKQSFDRWGGSLREPHLSAKCLVRQSEHRIEHGLHRYALPWRTAGNTDQVTSNGAGQFNGSAVASLSFTSTGSTPDLLTNISSFGNSGSTNPGLFLDNIAETANLGASLPAGQYTLANEIYNNIWAIAGLSGSPGYSASTTNLEESFNATFAVPDATPGGSRTAQFASRVGSDCGGDRRLDDLVPPTSTSQSMASVSTDLSADTGDRESALQAGGLIADMRL